MKVPVLIGVLAQYESTLIRLSNAEAQVEDLKLQLDDAMGAEEMLVSLTERNLMLGEVSRLTSITTAESTNDRTEN